MKSIFAAREPVMPENRDRPLLLPHENDPESSMKFHTLFPLQNLG